MNPSGRSQTPASALFHGLAILDFHQERYRPPFQYRRDDGLVTDYDIAALFAPERAWTPHERAMSEWVEGRVLDVGCGAGKHGLAFLGRGHDVLGIDVSPEAVQVCRERGLPAEVVDVRDIGAAGRGFDTVTFFSNGLSMAGQAGRVIELLHRLHGMTNPSGCIVLHNTDVTRSTSARHLRYQRANARQGRMVGQVRMQCVYRDRDSEWFDWLLLPFSDLEQVAAVTRWQVRDVVTYVEGTYCARLSKA